MCANCGAPVNDRFCAHCGQRVEHQVHSLGEFMGEAAEVITHADSRVWRTFVPLLLRPGFLTQQYLAGRRASYLPPFRLYIVLSVLFFLMVSLFTPAPHLQTGDPAQGRIELQKELDKATDPQAQAALRRSLQLVNALDTTKSSKPTDASQCETRLSGASLPDWLRARMVRGCRKITEDNGRELFQSVIHNGGRAMFVFLPLIAALMKLLYWRPRRHYVEHLLLLLHNHAFIFFSVSILLALNLIVRSDNVMGWLATALWFYCVWYLYRSMRRVYGQGRALTFVKFVVLGGAYFVCGLVTFILTFSYSALTL